MNKMAEKLSALSRFDLGDGVEATSGNKGLESSFIRAEGSDEKTNGDVIFTIWDNETWNEKHGPRRATVRIPKKVALEWAAIVAGECAK